jgi:hypothetical protein
MAATSTPDTTVDTVVWEPHPDHEGCSRVARHKTIREVRDELRVILGENPEGAEEYFTGTHAELDHQWPDGRLVVFAATGSNEGHYVHVGVIAGTEYMPCLLGKTFAGWAAAHALAGRLAQILGA